MEAKQGEIYWVKVKYIDTKGREQKKDRPYVVVSRNGLNRNGKIVVGVPFTSQAHRACAHRVLIPLSHMVQNPDCPRALKDSVALTDHIRVLDMSRLEQPKMGDLSETAKNGLEGALAFVFDIR
jgi:mRNA-degrading endonuclease toxin of MazEF toxin-antitoxin module